MYFYISIYIKAATVLMYIYAKIYIKTGAVLMKN